PKAPPETKKPPPPKPPATKPPKPKPPKPKPKPKPVVRRSVPHAAGAVKHAPPPNGHHAHGQWAYEVKFRSRHWNQRAFNRERPARTLYNYLGSRPGQRRLNHHWTTHNGQVSSSRWTVMWRTGYAHRFGIYSAPATARRVELSLR